MAEPFIYREAAPGQQAVQYAQIQAQQEMDRDRMNNELYRAMSQQATQLGVGSQQAAISRAHMQQRQAENEKDRELARQGYTNAQTVAGINSGVRGGIVDARLKAQMDADTAALKLQAQDNYSRGISFAEMLNNSATPLSLKQKLMQSGDVVMGPNGVWRSRHANPDQVESIGDIQSRFQPVTGIPGPVGGRIPSAMDSMPSRSRMLQAGPPPVGPRVSDFPSAPPGPSPFETPGFKVFRQSDFIPQPPPAYDASGNEYRRPAIPSDYMSNGEWRGIATPENSTGDLYRLYR